MFRLAAENLHSLINETLIPITPTQTLPTISAYQHFTWSPKFLMQFNINNVSRHNIGRQHIPGPGTSEKVSRVRRAQTSHITPSLITGRVCIIILRSASHDISQCQHCPCVGTSGPSQPLGTCFDCFCPDLTSTVIKFNYWPLTPQPVSCVLVSGYLPCQERSELKKRILWRNIYMFWWLLWPDIDTELAVSGITRDMNSDTGSLQFPFHTLGLKYWSTGNLCKHVSQKYRLSLFSFGSRAALYQLKVPPSGPVQSW